MAEGDPTPKRPSGKRYNRTAPRKFDSPGVTDETVETMRKMELKGTLGKFLSRVLEQARKD